MFENIGFIGAGNMASAMIGGIVASGILPPDKIFVSDIDETAANKLVEDHGVKGFSDNVSLAKKSKVLVLAVKPQVYGLAIDEIKEHISLDTLVISIAAGISIDDVKGLFERDLKVIRIMPNTPALVGEGMTALTCMPPVNASERDFAKRVFSSFGEVEEVDEKLLDAVTAVSGSSPAFVMMFVEAMADAAVYLGLPRDKAYAFASQAVKGSAKLISDTKRHPGYLKDMVCSPAGTTIEGVRILEEKGMRSAVFEALIATAKKAEELNRA